MKSIGDTKKRPAVVVSINIRNQFSSTVLIVPFTSDLAGGETPTRILVSVGEGGLESNSLATCNNILAVRKSALERGPYGQVSPASLERIQAGIQIVIDVF